MGGRNPPVFAGPWAGREHTMMEGVYIVTGVERKWAETDNSCELEVTYILDRNGRRR